MLLCVFTAGKYLSQVKRVHEPLFEIINSRHHLPAEQRKKQVLRPILVMFSSSKTAFSVHFTSMLRRGRIPLISSSCRLHSHIPAGAFCHLKPNEMPSHRFTNQLS
ncbi:hypothetical protein AVEN_212107-1 [Araneus ventricosus]|uniref:Uncharacterized protein n=1 Tax=Araneus ventricosus TaxID=182803 RepID=A0A4Y2RDV2_ARAVE|nr:hypothetical protein AVEN_212107-1 [Araneus ventricosus]